MAHPPIAFARSSIAFDAFVDERWEPLRGRPLVDRVMYGASELGDFALVWHLAGLVDGLTHDELDKPARVSLALGVESLLVNGMVKSFFRRSRPVEERDRPHHLRIPLTSSFPSGHASAAFTAATLLCRGPRSAIVLYPLAAVVALSRLHVRIHHGSDVAAGALVGLVLGVHASACCRPLADDHWNDRTRDGGGSATPDRPRSRAGRRARDQFEPTAI